MTEPFATCAQCAGHFIDKKRGKERCMYKLTDRLSTEIACADFDPIPQEPERAFYRCTAMVGSMEMELVGPCKIQAAKLGGPILDGYVLKADDKLVVIRKQRFDHEWRKVTR